VVVYLTVTERDRTERLQRRSPLVGVGMGYDAAGAAGVGPRTHRTLVVTDAAAPTPRLLEAIRRRAEGGAVQFRLIVLNPARAEIHALHPERHDRATQAESVLHAALPELQRAAQGPVIGSVSVRHDPMDAIEETVFGEPVDEIILDVPGTEHVSALRQDLEHRLAHLGLPITTIAHGS
jgi:hypothetical protein